MASVPLDNPEPGQPEALYVRASDGTLTHIDLPDILGYSQTSWSSDGSHVAFSAGYNRIIVVDVASGQVTDVGPGSSPHFAPDDPGRLVALRFVGKSSFVDVWQDGKTVASLKADDSDLAWCPGGHEIALATTAAVTTWNWRTGERRVVVQARFADGQLIENAVACF